MDRSSFDLEDEPLFPLDLTASTDDAIDESEYCEHGQNVLETSCHTCDEAFDRAIGIPIDRLQPERCPHGYRYDLDCEHCETELLASLDRVF